MPWVMDDGAESISASLQVTKTWEEWMCHPWAPRQPGETGWQEPHKFQQEVQAPAPLEQQLQAQEGAGANQLAKSLTEILPWLPQSLAGVSCLSPSEGSRWYLPARSSGCMDLCRSPWKDVKTVISGA